MFSGLLKHTMVYGIATIMPRILGFLLTPFYIIFLNSESDYGEYSSLMVYLILGNVLLSYGMETAFFRFANKKEYSESNVVERTALFSVAFSSVLFLLLCFLFEGPIAEVLQYDKTFVRYAALILFFDALAVIPFAWFRKREQSLRYCVVKLINVGLNFGFNLFLFLVLPRLDSNSFFRIIVFEDKIHYIFISYVLSSAITFVLLLPVYFKIRLRLDYTLWKSMMAYALPVLVSGIAFTINEGFDKLMLRYALPKDKSDHIVGIYSACYKMGVFITLFVTAFKLGIEPFFFKEANNKKSKDIYAKITLYFTILGSFIVLVVGVFTDLLKQILIPNEGYWEALWITPFILIGNLCLGLYNNFSVWYKIADKTLFGAYFSILGAILTLALNAVLIPIMSYKGSAVATFVAYGTMMLVSYIIGQKNYPIPYDLKKIGTYLLASVSFTFFNFFVLGRNIATGLVFILMFLALIYVLEKGNKKQGSSKVDAI